MHVLLVQPTANSTTFGWEHGLERLGHQVTVLTVSERLQFGGRGGARLHPLPNTAWSRRYARKSPLFHRLIDEVPDRAAVRTVLHDLRPDAALVKTVGVRNMMIATELHRQSVPWLLWQEKLPPLSRRWQVLGRMGVRPAAAFTALDSRPGGVADPEPESPMPRISYGPYLPANDLSSGISASEQVQNSPRSAIRVLVVASFKNHAAKQQWKVLEAAAKANLLDGSLHFTFSGQGGPNHVGYQRVAALVDQYDVEELVTFLPNTPFAGMPSLYRTHDVLVLPSAREQFGMAVVEAMVYGLPTLVSDAVGAIGCVVPEETGLVHPVGDTVALGQHLRRLVDEPGLRERLGRSASEFAAEHLDEVELARRILGLLPT